MQQWMRTVGYCWKKRPQVNTLTVISAKDVVEYWQTVFLPLWAEFLSWTHVYDDGIETQISHSYSSQSTKTATQTANSFLPLQFLSYPCKIVKGP